MRNAHKILIRKHEGKRPNGRPTIILGRYNIKMDLKKTGYGSVN
jgi:hypothetical protein